MILAGDIGGTNTTLALVRHRLGRFDILRTMRFSTQDERSLMEPLARFLAVLSEQGFKTPIDTCCISAAGPVRDGSIQLTNAPWSISGAEIQERMGIPVHLINDFTAVSYAVVLLDAGDREQIRHIPHTDGAIPMPGQGMALVVGAGTGLGMGFVDKGPGGTCRAFPSEGGHSSLPCWDELSLDYYLWMGERIGSEPGIELAASGQGIGNIFGFLCSDSFNPATASRTGTAASHSAAAFGARGCNPGEIASSILLRSEQERPALIAANRRADPRCSLTMELFCEYYARKVSSLASVFLPSGGIYLAGGISSKNEDFLVESNRFMRIFERNYAPHIQEFLADLPVMIVRNYSISLIGAANAAIQLGR